MYDLLNLPMLQYAWHTDSQRQDRAIIGGKTLFNGFPGLELWLALTHGILYIREIKDIGERQREQFYRLTDILQSWHQDLPVS